MVEPGHSHSLREVLVHWVSQFMVALHNVNREEMGASLGTTYLDRGPSSQPICLPERGLVLWGPQLPQESREDSGLEGSPLRTVPLPGMQFL